jgi:hypothetical protein
MYLQDELNLLYVAGHNVVLFRTDDQEQTLFPGRRFII